MKTTIRDPQVFLDGTDVSASVTSLSFEVERPPLPRASALSPLSFAFSVPIVRARIWLPLKRLADALWRERVQELRSRLSVARQRRGRAARRLRYRLRKRLRAAETGGRNIWAARR